MTDLGPLAERLRKVEDHREQLQTMEKESKFGEGLDGRVLEKVIVALESRLTEHAGQVDRRLAEIDAQVALDLKAVDTHTSAQTNAVEKAIQQIEAQVRDYVTAAQQSTAEQIAGVDQRLSALQEALPAKFREIIEAVRQSMEARLALELTQVESRVAAGRVAPQELQDLDAKLRAELEALSNRLSVELQGLAEQQQSQTAPLQQALEQLESKLTSLREELPPKIRQIVEAVESSIDARISAGGQQVSGRMAGLEEALAALRAAMPTADSYQQVLDEHLRHHAEQVGALDRKLTVLQEELPPKIKAIVDAVRDSMDARMAVELKAIDEQHRIEIEASEARLHDAQRQFRQEVAAESRTPALAQDVARLQADLAVVEARIETGNREVTAHFGTALEALQARHHDAIEQIEARLRTAVDQMGQSLESRLAGEIRELQARGSERSPDLEKTLQYASLLEARIQALEQKLQRSAEETVDRAVERVWQSIESRLRQRSTPAPAAAAAQPPETITGLRQKSTSAEQSVLDLIAGIGQLFEKPSPKGGSQTPAEPAKAVEPEAAAAEDAAPAPAEPEIDDKTEPPGPVAGMPEEPAKEAPEPAEPPAAVPALAASDTEANTDEAPVILFRPKEAGRKWRIPFVSSFLVMAVTLAWLEYM